MKEKDVLKYNIYADFYRAYGESLSKQQIFLMLFNLSYQGPKYILYMRIANYFYKTKRRFLAKLVAVRLMKMSLKHGVEISYKSKIGEGLSMPHCNNIIIGEATVIGKNCTILQGATIGSNLFKARYKLATVGDNVLIGAGAKIIGPIKIGNNVTIGANSVITKDIPDNVVVAGSPAKVVSQKPAVEINQDYKKYKEFVESGSKIFS
jgi:serine O-acetyltransferase